MDRNTMAYAEVDTIETPRSTWTRSHTHKTTFNAGKLIPIYFDEDIIPGSTIKHKTSFVVRLQTPLNPTMDNLYIDTYWFAGKKWWYWEHFKDQMGENKLGEWTTNQIEYTTPQINVTTAYGVNDTAAYMGIPIGITGFKYDRLGLNFLCDIWNYWFRSQVVHAPKIYDTGDSTLTSDGTIFTGYGLLPTCRNYDYFSSALPEPQKSGIYAGSTGIKIPLGTTAPVIGNGMTLGLTDGTNLAGLNAGGASGSYPGALGSALNMYGKNVGDATGTTPVLSTTSVGVTTDGTKSGIVADLTAATAASINALRLAFATQRILEKDARFGTTYQQLLRQFGAVASSEDVCVARYLGGKRVPINIETCLQNSSTDNTSPLGATGAFSVTADVNEDFTYSTTTHDMIFGLCTVRVGTHTYQQGLARQFSRLRRFDHYWTSLSFIGNTPIYNREIFLQSDSVVNADGNPVNDDVFGYKEAWQEYLYKQSRISGELLSTYSNSLDVWHYGDDYASLPGLSDTWMEEPIENIDRTLTVQSSEAHQFIADFYFEETVSAPIPINRTPGLIDHY